MTHFPREERDTGGGPLAAMAFAAAFLAGAAAVLNSVQARLGARVGRADAGRSQVRTPAPPGPRLQLRPAGSLERLRSAEDDRLSGWSWADRKAGLARVPVERAMDALARGEAKP